MLSFYLSQQWNDQRLIFNASEINDRDHIKLGEGSWLKVWVPDTFFRNEKRVRRMRGGRIRRVRGKKMKKGGRGLRRGKRVKRVRGLWEVRRKERN